MRRVLWPGVLAFLVCWSPAAPAAPAGERTWRIPVEPGRIGPFPFPADFSAEFEFGWSEVVAGRARAVVRSDGGVSEVRVDGGTIGLARALWRLDATHVATLRTGTLQSIWFWQVERYARKTLTTEAAFRADGLWRLRRRTPDGGPSKWKRIPVEPVEGVVAAMFGIRSQALDGGQEVRTVAFPGGSAFVVSVTVLGRERLSTPAGEFPAIRMALDLERIEIKGDRAPTFRRHEKFRSGTVWISDDEMRIPLRAEVRIFIGYVYGELTSLQRPR